MQVTKPPRPVDPLLLDEPGRREALLGNEAIVRGALEAGVAFACGYPGTPSSEVTDSFGRIADQAGIIFEYSVNEKVALEMAFAASLAGARSICAMKHLGLMVAGDPLSTIPYMGVKAGMVVVSAGDPSCRTSPNEQDQRHLAAMLHVPVLDPSTPEEARDMARFAFHLSEETGLPVIFRITTRACHSRGVVEYGPLVKPEVTGFVRDPGRLVPIPVNARPLRVGLKDRVERARQMLQGSAFIRSTGGDGEVVLLASGPPAAACADLLDELELSSQVRLITVGCVFPLPEQRLLELLRGVQTVLVVEELSPFLEDALAALATREGRAFKILGKRSGHLPEEFEYEPPVIRKGLHRALGLGPAPVEPDPPPDVAPRPPILCAGCSHRASYFAARTVFGDDQLYFNDIGCYTLGYGPPLNTADALLCMGASVTLAAGVSRATGQRTVGFIGDSTFFHSGMPPLLNAVKEGVSMALVILDNSVTAMTGFQESPMVVVPDGEPKREVSIEGLVRALGVKHVERVDPYDLAGTMEAMTRARDGAGVSVVISERPCTNFLIREGGLKGPATPYHVDHDRCQTCGREDNGLRCGQCVSASQERQMARGQAMCQWEEDHGADAKPPVATCSARCPISLCVQGYVTQIAAGQYRNALEMILERNPLADTVCRICHHPCEGVCVRGELDEPIAINELKRFVLDWAAEQGEQVLPEPGPGTGKRVAVVGAGPAGLAAAHDLRLRGHQVSLLDANPEPGGLLLFGIPGFRLPREALQRDVARVLGLGVEFRGGCALGRDVTLAELLGQERFDAVFLAVGALRGMALGLDGEDAEGAPVVLDALTYLRGVNLARPLPTGERVVVVGGGNAAMDAARTALRQGARRVVVAYRRRREEMPAIPSEVTAALDEGVELLTQVSPLSINRDDQPGLQVVRTEPGEPDSSGRRRPVPMDGSELLLHADQIITAIGQAPDPDVWADHEGVALEKHRDGSVRVDPETAQTSHPRVFAGGDMVWGERTVTSAMAWGQRAAWGMDRLLRGEERADERVPPPATTTLEPTPGPWLHRTDIGSPRQRAPEREAPGRANEYHEVVGALSEQQARDEAERCLGCGECGNCRSCIDLFGCPAFFLAEDGRPQIDPALCIGCGVCAAICPNGAINKAKD